MLWRDLKKYSNIVFQTRFLSCCLFPSPLSFFSHLRWGWCFNGWINSSQLSGYILSKSVLIGGCVRVCVFKCEVRVSLWSYCCHMTRGKLMSSRDTSQSLTCAPIYTGTIKYVSSVVSVSVFCPIGRTKCNSDATTLHQKSKCQACFLPLHCLQLQTPQAECVWTRQSDFLHPASQEFTPGMTQLILCRRWNASSNNLQSENLIYRFKTDINNVLSECLKVLMSYKAATWASLNQKIYILVPWTWQITCVP